MLRGEALLFLSSAIHAGGGNVTREPRLLHAIFFCRSWVRPEVFDISNRIAYAFLADQLLGE